MAPARWLTPTGLAWTAAGVTTILAFGAAVLAVLGRDVSVLLVPALLALRRPVFPGSVVTRAS